MPPSTTSRVSNTPLTQPPPPPPSNQIYSYTPPPQPIASSCHNHPDLLHKYMSYTPFSLCPSDSDLARRISYPPWLAPPPPPPLLLPNRAAQTLIPSPSRPFPFFTLRFLSVDLVRCGCAVNRWILVTMMEFLLFDVDMVLRGGGYLWIDRFFSKGVDLYAPLIGKLGYKKVKWAAGKEC
ncbi:hypothetical protein HN51_047057 [Arachis hypogaea]